MSSRSVFMAGNVIARPCPIRAIFKAKHGAIGAILALFVFIGQPIAGNSLLAGSRLKNALLKQLSLLMSITTEQHFLARFMLWEINSRVL